MGLLSTITDKVKGWFAAAPKPVEQAVPVSPVLPQLPVAAPQTLPKNQQELLAWAQANPLKLDALIAQNPQAQLIKDAIANNTSSSNLEHSSFDSKQFSSPRIQFVDDSGAGSMPRIIELKMDNGMKVLLVPDDTASKVHLSSVYSVGSNQDPIPGTAHALEHIAGGGAASSSFKKGEMTDLYEYHGAKAESDYNAGTCGDFTFYWASLDPSLLELMMKVESERMDQLDLNDIDDVLKREKSLINSEIDMINDRTGHLIANAMKDLTIPNSIANNNVIGTKESVASIDKQKLQDFYQYYKDPSNLTLVVSGKIGSPQRLEHLLLNYFANKEKPAQVKPKPIDILKRPSQSPPAKDREQTILKAGDSKALALAYRGPNYTEKDCFVMSFILEALSKRGPKSRLVKKLTEAKKINIGLDCSPLPSKGDSLNLIIVHVDKIVDLDELKAEVKKVLAEVKANGLDEDELRKIKQEFLYEQIHKQEDANAQASQAMEYDQYGDWHSAANATKIAQGITNDDIKRVANAVLVDDNEYTVYLKPTEKKEEKKAPAILDKALDVKELEVKRLEALTKAIIGDKQVTLPDLKVQDSGQVILNENHRLPKVAIRMESPRQPLSNKDMYTAQVLTSLFFQSGTMSQDKDQVFERLEDLGAGVDFNIGHEGVGFNISTVSIADNLAKTLELFKEMILGTRLDSEKFVNIKAGIKNSIKEENENHAAILRTQLMNKVYPAGHYHHQASQLERWQMVDSITYADVMNLWERIKQSNFVIAGSGDLKQDDLNKLQLVMQDWSKQPARNIGNELVGAHRADLQELEGNEFKALQDQSFVTLGQQLELKNTDPDFYALYLAKEILGGATFSSRLMRTIRESQGNVYSANAYFSNYRNADGIFQIVAASQKGNGKNLAQQLKNVLSNFPADITEDELNMAKQNFIKSYVKDKFEDNDAIADHLLDNRLKGRDLDFVKQIPAMIEGIQLPDIQNAIAKHIDLKNIHEVIVDDKIVVDGQEIDTSFDAKAYKARLAAPVAAAITVPAQFTTSV